jgi:carboxyl-terminal processing protease
MLEYLRKKATIVIRSGMNLVGGNRKTPLLIIFLILVIALSFGAGFAVSRSEWCPLTPCPSPGKIPTEFNRINEVWNILTEDFVDRSALDPDRLSKGAVQGMLDSLDEPYTAYLDTKAYELVQENLRGSFEGIGVVVTKMEERLVIVTPIEGSPAERAGIRALDEILRIEGMNTSRMSLSEVAARIRGPKDSMVRLTILRPGQSASIELEIIREEINLISVYSNMLPDNIMYIRITDFSQRTGDELASALKELPQQNVESLILDLRNNLGGLLTAVIDVSSQFLDEDEIVLYEVNGRGEQKVYRANKGGLAKDIPLAVLVNEYTASGGEVLAGTIRAHQRGPLVGTTTYGKGSICAIHQLQDNSALYLTTARWLTPNREQIEGKGFVPDIPLEIIEEDCQHGEDPQLQAAIDYLLNP